MLNQIINQTSDDVISSNCQSFGKKIVIVSHLVKNGPIESKLYSKQEITLKQVSLTNMLVRKQFQEPSFSTVSKNESDSTLTNILTNVSLAV